MIHSINVRRVLFMSFLGFLFVSIFAVTHAETAIKLDEEIITGETSAPFDSLLLLEAELMELEDDINLVSPPFKSAEQRARYYKVKCQFEKTREHYAKLAAVREPDSDLAAKWRWTAVTARRKHAEYDRQYCSAVYDMRSK